ncbi:MAG: VOC family protein [Nanoarchaeota archaeon]|nr:VOC family protein [Nanoarchaeota archaeon]
MARAKHEEPRYVFEGPGLHHFCFVVESEDEVNEIYKWLKKEDINITDPPTHYPQYTDKYYATFFFDPDGIKLEIAYY